MQLLHSFRRLGSVLRGVLPPAVYADVAARLVQAVCGRLIGGRGDLGVGCLLGGAAHALGACCFTWHEGLEAKQSWLGRRTFQGSVSC